MPHGRPIIDTDGGTLPNGYPDTLYYAAEGLAGMRADLRAAVAARAHANPNFAGVIPVGDAFQHAVDTGISKADGFHTSNDPGRTDSEPGGPRQGAKLKVRPVSSPAARSMPAVWVALPGTAASNAYLPADAVSLEKLSVVAPAT